MKIYLVTESDLDALLSRVRRGLESLSPTGVKSQSDVAAIDAANFARRELIRQVEVWVSAIERRP